MSLSTGTRLGAYEILTLIGSGGMGEVYRARDTKLKRDVALKILPTEFALDPGRLARFKREAQVLASLNHPHIAAIYGVEESGDVHALVLELVEGPTLADRIAQGAIPLDEALPMARQIAEALEAAHEQGIIHRDLKPSNIKLRPDGTTKVLDFGLAKVLTPPAEISSLEAPTTTASLATESDLRLGTAAYMSPEQASGTAVDKRTDIWAFGCVLYEMLTGECAFRRETVAGTLAAVLAADPLWERLPTATLPGLQHLLRRCLRKDPKRRLRDIGDAWELLDQDAPRLGVTIPRWQRLLPWSLAGVLAVASLVLMFAPRQESGTSQVTRLELNLPPGVELNSLGTVAMSPDGRRVAFIAGVGGLRQIYVRSLDALNTAPIRGTENAYSCFFSPDSHSIGFLALNQGLRKVSLADGLAATVATHTDIEGAAWGSDDRIVFVRSGALWRVSASGGAPEQLTIPNEEDRKIRDWPALLPAGGILFASYSSSGDARLEALVPTTGKTRVIVEHEARALYVPSGHLIFYSHGELRAAPFDVDGLSLTGPQVRVLEGVSHTGDNWPLADVSRTGTLVYAPPVTAQLVWVSRTGAEQPIPASPRPYAYPRLAPGGSRLLVQSGELGIQDLTRGTFTHLTNAEAVADALPVWTPDSRIVFRSATGLRVVSENAGRSSEAFAGTTLLDYPASVTPDGRLVFIRQSAKTSADIYVASLRGDSRITAVLNTPAYEGGPRLSPNGRWIAYSSNESGRMEVFLSPFPRVDRKAQVSVEGGTQATWNPNGQEIFYRNGTKMMSVAVSTAPTLSLRAPRLLFDHRYAFGAPLTIPNYDVSPDGERFLMIADESSSGRLNVVLNWTDELKQRVPTR